MSSAIARLLILVCAALAVVPATAGAATKSSIPKVTSVAPMKLKIGDRLTIKGSGFLKGKNRNTVVFKASGQRAVFVKAESATTTKVVVKVPSKLASFLKASGGQPSATRFQLRVLARKLSKAYTPAKASPVISPSSGTSAKKSSASSAATAAVAAPDCDRDGASDAADSDDDNDLLPDTLEGTLGTGACNADTDGDGMQDGWEYQSARDLNAESCPATDHPIACLAAKPSPTKRSYTNPLYWDAGEDYDGDYLPAGWEYAAWKRHGATDLNDLWYSDGMQSSQDSDPTDGCRGLVESNVNGHVDKYPVADAYPQTGAATPRYAWLYGHSEYTLDTQAGTSHPNAGCLSDAERDEDGDFLSNSQELNRHMSGPDYVQAIYEEPPYKTVYEGTEPLDADTDGDGVVDGLDDQDFDDFWNVEEIRRGTKSAVDGVAGLARTGLWVDPYNPCVPAIHSRTCPQSLLLDGTAWMPFKYSDDDDPKERWPLYRDAEYGTEVWNGVPQVDQVLPMRPPGQAGAGLEHPLLPRPV